MKFFLKSAAILFISFLVARLFFLFYYTLPTHPDADLVIKSFFQGIRFDLAGISITLVIPFLMANIPFLNQNMYWKKTTAFSQSLLIIQIWFLFFADFFFYPEAKKRLGYEAFVYLNKNIIPIVGTIFGQHKTLFISFFILSILSIYLSHKILLKELLADSAKNPIKKFSSFFVGIIVLLLAARGGTQRVPLRPGDSFISTNQSINHAVLSSPFNVYYTLAHSTGAKKFMDSNVAQKVVLESIDWPAEKMLNANYPILHTSDGPKESRKYNVIILLMESWTAKYTGIHGDTKYTPSLNRILPKSVIFPNFFASGVRTTNGLYSVLMGMPDQSSVPMMMRSGLQSRHTSLSKILKSLDYTSLFIHGGPLDFDNLRPMVIQEGFDKIIGKEDFKDSGGTEKVWGYDDEFIFHRALKEIKNLPAPYFSYLLSVTSHAPYEVPKNYNPIFSDPQNDHRKLYLNALHYSDYSLGKFLEAFESDPAFKNTILVITGDHTYHGYELNYFENMNVPLVIYAPNILKPAVNKNIGTHADILPTIMSLIGQAPIASLGTNLLEKQSDSTVKYFINGIDVGVITNKYIAFKSLNDKPPIIFDYIKGDFKTDIGSSNPEVQKDLKQKIEAYYQFSTELVEENRLSP